MKNLSYEQIQEQLIETLEKLEVIVPEYAQARAQHDKHKELLKIKLHLLEKLDSGTTNAERQRNAYANSDYRTYVNELYKEDVQYWILEARKKSLEERIGVFRSLLSFEKNQINNTI